MYFLLMIYVSDSIKVARPFTYADDTKLLMVMHNSFDNVRTLTKFPCGVAHGTCLLILQMLSYSLLLYCDFSIMINISSTQILPLSNTKSNHFHF